MDELRDIASLSGSAPQILRNICRTLNCSESDIGDIALVSGGLTNKSFRFSCLGERYVYRHPGANTDKIISRKSEAFSTAVARKLGLDKVTIVIDGVEGWKISKYIPNARQLDYHNMDQVRDAIGMVKRLHSAAVKSEYDFDIWGRTLDLVGKTADFQGTYGGFDSLYGEMRRLYGLAQRDEVPWVLCHCDFYAPNFLLSDGGGMDLIDWEYSGNDDPANDLGNFICSSDYSYDQAMEIFRIYYGREPSFEELRHNVAYVAITSFYWYVWAIFQESIDNSPGSYLKLWHDNAVLYMQKAMEMYT